MEKIVIAKVLKPQGIKGELKCKPFADESFFENLKEVFIQDKRFEVLSSVYRFGYVYITLNDVNTRNDAESFRNKEILVDKNLFADTLLISDIENCKIVDEFNNELGFVESIEQYGSADILNIILNDNKKISIPCVDDIVLKVLPIEKLIIVNRAKFEEQKIED